MENCLNIAEVLHKEEETFDEEKFKFINSKISIATFFLMPHMIDIWTYLSKKNQPCLGCIMII